MLLIGINMGTNVSTPRDYRLTGPEATRAVERGLAGADWYHSPVDREAMLEIMKRSNRRATLDTILWLLLLAASATWLVTTWVSWWTIPAMFVYGTLYGSASDARWHECGHRTAFKSKAANLVVYHIASFMDVREPVSWRWSHNRHHADTIVVGRDAEIAYPRPTPTWKILLEMFAVLSVAKEFAKYGHNLLGRLHPDEATYVPAREKSRAILWGRIHVAVWVGVITASIVSESWLPLVLVGLPSMYGRWLLVVFGTTQHAGLAEDVLDHRLNTRTVHMNAVWRFLYLNMNYHLEHHMYPSVPYHALPRLHALIKDDLPEPFPNMRAAYKVILPALRRQRLDPNFALSPGYVRPKGRR
jgi:fatty acid desaturase